MQEVTLFVAILLGVGFLLAKLGQLVRLPSVTGYILAGLLLGPSGLHLITVEEIGTRLSHFTQIALMLIAFGIGEHLEIRKLRHQARSVGWIGISESLAAFLLVAGGLYFLTPFLLANTGTWQWQDFFVFAILLGAIAVETAAASTLHVTRELKASGPLTAALLPVVAVDNGLAIMLFGITSSVAHNLMGVGGSMPLVALMASMTEIVLSLLLGVVTGLTIDAVVRRLKHRGEMLTIGLALLLLCGEVARLLGFSSLLAGMAAGFTIVNRDYRDVRLFRALNAFETPVYVLFFTLAGAHLDLSMLQVAGWVGFFYFCLRVAGKVSGAMWAARRSSAQPMVRRYLGFTLVPQAGLAIGLILLLGGDPSLSRYSSLITQVVLAGVILAELLGPICTKMALERAGETHVVEEAEANGKQLVDADSIGLVPWHWARLKPPAEPKGVVLFGASHHATIGSLARMATLFAHHYGSRPLAVRIVLPEGERAVAAGEERQLFANATAEAGSLGYELATSVVRAETVAEGIVDVARQSEATAIVLGHPLKGTAQDFQRVVDAVAAQAPCPVVVVRFAGVLHTERILVPLVNLEDLEVMRPAILALAQVGEHRLTFLHLLSPESAAAERTEARQRLVDWVAAAGLGCMVQCQVVTTEARVLAIVKMSSHHDLLVMAAPQAIGLPRLFLGSLAEDVALRCATPLLIVHNPDYSPAGAESPQDS
ncbi:MAG: cation:proton antiporter [Desulfobulbaceae bacterium]|nr:cation:proton antiporter [Desulfobulbaceae bacterium]